MSNTRFYHYPTFKLLVWGLVLVTLMAIADRLFWGFELYAHFTVQYIWISIVLLCYAVLQKQTKYALICTGLMMLHTAEIIWVAKYYSQKGEVAGEQISLNIMQANIYCNNRQKEKATKEIIQEAKAVDVLVLIEYCNLWKKQLHERLYKVFPFSYVTRPGTASRPIGVYSKTALSGTDEAVDGTLNGYLRIHLLRYDVLIYAHHGYVPSSSYHSQKRSQTLRQMLLTASELLRPTVAIGDFNQTPYATSFQQTLSDTGFKLARFPDGLYPTWLTLLPTPFMRIPIDHILANNAVTIARRKPVYITGSDHVAMVNEIQLSH